MNRLPRGFDRTNALVALAVWVSVLVVYLLTKAPTLSFWDCGEFIAACYTLGIPHPPGTPMYLLMGRVFSIIPFFTDICARVNFLSSLSSSIAAMFGYLIAVRVVRGWFAGDKSLYSRILVYAGAAAGAFFLAFGRTQWSNSVEAEVYGMSMMLLLGMVWLTLVYYEHRETTFGDKLLLLVVYIGFLGIGVHMTTFVALPVCAVMFVVKKSGPLRVWALIAALFVIELFLIFALSSRPGEIPYWLPILIVFVFYVFYIMSFDEIPRSLVYVGLAFLFACLPLAAALRGIDYPVATYVSVVAFAGLVLYAAYVGYRWLTNRSSRPNSVPEPHDLVSALFILAAGLLCLVTVSGMRGYHAFLFLSAVLVAVIGMYTWRHLRLPILLALLATSMVILGVREYFYGSLIALAVISLWGTVWKARGWKTAVLLILVAAAGYSVHLTLPIRSSLHPSINENNPSQSLAATINFIERKQYGSQGMIERMFERRSEWENQFGDHRRMGFWGFLEEQFGVQGWGFLLLFILGVFGLWETVRRRPEMGTVLLILMLLTTAGLVLYMNFADGTRMTPQGGDYLEVRDRDYFFTPGFMLMGLAIGMGIVVLAQFLRDSVRRFSPGPRKVILACGLVPFLLPVYAVQGNYYYCDRSENYIPYDYTYNLLLSCDENAVLFTCGDNDTFPIWCLQEVYGIRPDVKNINLALSNTDWYTKQIRTNLGLSLGWSDEQIEDLRPYRFPDGGVYRVQDQVRDAVIRHNGRDVPVNFSFTCPGSARMFERQSLDSLLMMKGLVHSLTDTVSDVRVDTDASLELFTNPNKFKYRGWNDPGVYQDEATLRLTSNVANAVLLLSNGLIRKDQMEESEGALEYIIGKIPYADEAVIHLSKQLSVQGDTAAVARLIESQEGVLNPRLELSLARAYRVAGDEPAAERLCIAILEKHSSFRDGLDELMALYIAQRNMPAMVSALQTWVQANPQDHQIRAALNDLMRQLEAYRQQGGDGP